MLNFLWYLYEFFDRIYARQMKLYCTDSEKIWNRICMKEVGRILNGLAHCILFLKRRTA